jgi:predicted lipid-binding transport protein (Tim44 family)
MATIDRQHYALQTIFSFFLGLMVVAFVGVGVNTFYPSPGEAFQKQLQPLYDQQSTLQAGGKTLTPAESAQATAIQKQINAIQERQRVEEQAWSLNTSIVLVLFATMVGGISLVRSEQLRVLSNGLLLGGLFTMLYGMGWTIASGTSNTRFFVVLFALAVTIGLGYMKFVRLRQGGPAVSAGTPAGAAASVSTDAMALEARVAALEARTTAAAAALGTREPH